MNGKNKYSHVQAIRLRENMNEDPDAMTSPKEGNIEGQRQGEWHEKGVLLASVSFCCFLVKT